MICIYGVPRVVGNIVVNVSQCERVILMHKQKFVQHIDVVVRSWAQFHEAFVARHVKPNEVGGRIVCSCCLRVPESPVEGHDPQSAQDPIEKPNQHAGIDEDVPLAAENLNVVVHREKHHDREYDVCNEKNLIMAPAKTVDREDTDGDHEDGCQFAVPEIMFGQVLLQQLPTASVLADEDRVTDRMHHSLHCSYSSCPSVEVVVRSKAPSSQPHQDIISGSEKPHEWEIGERYHACTV